MTKKQDESLKKLSDNLTIPKNIPQNLTAIRLSPEIRLRREYFGGLVYDTRNGNTLEVDKGAFQFLDLTANTTVRIDDLLRVLVQNKIIRHPHRSIGATLGKLFELNIFEDSNETPSSPVLTDQGNVSHKPWLSAPETVHWAVTQRCDENCPDCYARRSPVMRTELNTREALKLIEKIAGWGVFQLAIGGGEPFARRDLSQLVHYAAALGLSVHITTGKSHIDTRILEGLSDSIKNLQLGLRPDDLLGPDSRNKIQQIQSFFTTMQSIGITPGANIFVTKSAIQQITGLVKRLVHIGFHRIILLRYKPPESIERWKAENPKPYQMKKLHEEISNIIQQNPQLNIRVDCSLSFIQRYLPSKLANQLGIKGCVAADRILALGPDGSAYPCSQLVHPRCFAGNLLEMEPQLLWDQSRILRRYRLFRTQKAFTHSWCGVCRAKETCGGCRVFASDAMGGDPGCPEQLLPPLTQLGKIGRGLDLAQYLKNRGTISVGEYMKRYGVEQRTAIKELNNSPDAISISGKPAKKKMDNYASFHEDVISDIQGSIGYTSAGFPFATHEQIAEWIEGPSDVEGYPLWIKSHVPIHRELLCKSRGKKKKRKKAKRKEGKDEDIEHTQRVSGGSQFDIV